MNKLLYLKDYDNFYATEEANAKRYLRKLKCLDSYLNITNYSIFMKGLKDLRDRYRSEYNIDMTPFYSESNGKLAVPNKELFRKIDNLKGITY